MKRFLIKRAGREEGPFYEAQIAQMLADQRINRSTPCKPEAGGDWRTVDDYLPMLKYGTQLPPPTASPVGASLSPSPLSSADRRVAIVDVDVPFTSVLKMLFKGAGAALIVGVCMMPVVIILWVVFMLIFAGLLGGFVSGLPQP